MNNYRKPRVRVIGSTSILLRGSFGYIMDFSGHLQIA